MQKKIGLGYYLSHDIDYSYIEKKQQEIQQYKEGKYKEQIDQYLKTFDDIINLDCVIASDNLEAIKYGTQDVNIQKVKDALLNRHGILAFIPKPGRQIQVRELMKKRRNVLDGNNYILKQDKRAVSYSRKFKNMGILGSGQDINGVDLVLIDIFNNKQVVLPNKNHIIALQAAIAKGKEARITGKGLSLDFIERLNSYLFMGTDNALKSGFGKIRKTNVEIYGNIWEIINFNQIKKRDDIGNIVELNNVELLDAVKKVRRWYNSAEAKQLPPLERAAILSVEIARLQAFRDGNKRTSRLLANYSLARDAYPVLDFHIERDDYIKMLAKTINSKDITEYVEWFKQMIENEQDLLLSQFQELEHFNENEQIRERQIAKKIEEIENGEFDDNERE